MGMGKLGYDHFSPNFFCKNKIPILKSARQGGRDFGLPGYFEEEK